MFQGWGPVVSLISLKVVSLGGKKNNQGSKVWNRETKSYSFLFLRSSVTVYVAYHTSQIETWASTRETQVWPEELPQAAALVFIGMA